MPVMPVIKVQPNKKSMLNGNLSRYKLRLYYYNEFLPGCCGFGNRHHFLVCECMCVCASVYVCVSMFVCLCVLFRELSRDDEQQHIPVLGEVDRIIGDWNGQALQLCHEVSVQLFVGTNLTIAGFVHHTLKATRLQSSQNILHRQCSYSEKNCNHSQCALIKSNWAK